MIVSLDGEWLLATDPTNVGRDQRWWEGPRPDTKPAKVPWIIQDAFPGYHGVAWYWREVMLPPNPHRRLLGSHHELQVLEPVPFLFHEPPVGVDPLPDPLPPRFRAGAACKDGVQFVQRFPRLLHIVDAGLELRQLGACRPPERQTPLFVKLRQQFADAGNGSCGVVLQRYQLRVLRGFSIAGRRRVGNCFEYSPCLNVAEAIPAGVFPPW